MYGKLVLGILIVSKRKHKNESNCPILKHFRQTCCDLDKNNVVGNVIDGYNWWRIENDIRFVL